MGHGRQIKYKWPNAGISDYGDHVRSFFTFYTKINDKYVHQEFITYAQFYHGQLGINPLASISATPSSLGISFSINPSIGYAKESHPMEVRAKNIYMN